MSTSFHCPLHSSQSATCLLADMEVSVLEVVEHPKFQCYLSKEKFWRTHGNLKIIFGDVLKVLTNINHAMDKECQCDSVAKRLSSKLKTKKSMLFKDFKEAESVWMTTFKFKMCCGFVDQRQVVAEGAQQEMQEAGQEQVVQPSPCKAVQVDPAQLEPRDEEPPPAKKRRTSYCTAGRATRYEMLREEMRRISQDLKFEEDLRERLQKRGRKRSKEEQEQRTTTTYFDEFLSCFNAIDGINISLNKWDFLRMWIRDYIERGGDISKLPCAKTLRIYREKMVAPGLIASTTVARVSLQSVFKHTVERLALRPDVYDYLDLLEDGAVLEVLWKWGMDGQNGEIIIVYISLPS